MLGVGGLAYECMSVQVHVHMCECACMVSQVEMDGGSVCFHVPVWSTCRFPSFHWRFL